MKKGTIKRRNERTKREGRRTKARKEKKGLKKDGETNERRKKGVPSRPVSWSVSSPDARQLSTTVRFLLDVFTTRRSEMRTGASVSSLPLLDWWALVFIVMKI